VLRLYTFADRRPDFLPLQVRSIARFLQDEHEFVVFNNALNNTRRSREIDEVCKDLGLRTIKVTRERVHRKIGGQSAFTLRGNYRNPNVACAYPLIWSWERILEENASGMFALIDSDMFFCRPVSLVERVADNQAGVIMQYRGINEELRTADVSYFWNAFAIFKPQSIPDLEGLRWDCGVTSRGKVNGHLVDVGGFIHYWLKSKRLDLHHFAETAVYSIEREGHDQLLVHLTYNGNLNIKFRFNTRTESIDQVSLANKNRSRGSQWVFPHLPDHSISDLITAGTNILKKFDLARANYGEPTILGFVHSESSQSDNSPFIIHHKAGSGYLGHSKDYLQRKIEFIQSCVDDN
jgi:hypothetical protein